MNEYLANKNELQVEPLPKTLDGKAYKIETDEAMETMPKLEPVTIAQVIEANKDRSKLCVCQQARIVTTGKQLIYWPASSKVKMQS